jgi:hypothetical protein
MHDIEDTFLCANLVYYYRDDPAEPLLVEASLEGTMVAPLRKYRNLHLRICRPKGLLRADAELVMRYCIGCIGLDYDVRDRCNRLRTPQTIDPGRSRRGIAAGERRYRGDLPGS